MKLWLKLVHVFHNANLNSVDNCADSCSAAVGAAILLHSPGPEFGSLVGDFRFVYLGLPVPDQKYYSVYCRPRIGAYLPPPIDFYGELAHLVRKLEANLSNKNKTLVFVSEKDISADGTVEAGK